MSVRGDLFPTERTQGTAGWVDWLREPGNPDKGKKYAYALFGTYQGLRKEFPDWQTKVPPSIVSGLQPARGAEEDIRIRYARVLSHLREALTRGDSIKGIRSLAYHKFTRVYMYSLIEDFICKALRAPQSAAEEPYEVPLLLTLQNLPDEIRKANRRLITVPSAYKQRGVAKEVKKFREVVGWNFDPLLDSNTPWVHSIQKITTHEGEKECTILRHGTPTCDPGVMGMLKRPFQFQANIVPEYVAYLEAHPEKQTLYVNHQEYEESGKPWANPEIDRSHVIQQLEKKHPNFHFLSLPMDGFFWREDYLKEVSIEKLKRDLFHSLIAEVNGFALPTARKEVDTEIERILEDVQARYFHPKEVNTPSLKKIYLMLFYSDLKDYLKDSLHIDFLVSACSDHTDRGNASATVDMMKNLVKLGEENNPSSLREVFISALAPFIIYNEHLDPARLEVALDVIAYFSKLTDKEKRTIRERPSRGFRLLGQRIPKEKKSWARMVGANQFLACVENMRNLREKRAVLDPHFQVQVVSSFQTDGRWDLGALKRQIAIDLPRCDTRIDGERVVELDRLFEKLGLQGDPAKEEELLPLIAMLQQGAVGQSMRDVSFYFNGNAAGLVVAQGKLSEAREEVHSLIDQSRTHPELAALALETKRRSEDDFELAAYVSSAVNTGLLSAEFMPVGWEEASPIPVYPTRIYAQSQEQAVAIEQELALTDPEWKGPRPIALSAFIAPDRPAEISWHFV